MPPVVTVSTLSPSAPPENPPERPVTLRAAERFAQSHSPKTVETAWRDLCRQWLAAKSHDRGMNFRGFPPH